MAGDHHPGPQSLATLLNEWDVSEEVINNFTDNGMTIDLLCELTPANLKELCPHMETRLNLMKKIIEYIESQDECESPIVGEVSMDETLSRPTSDFEEDLSLICSSCDQLQKTFEQYVLHVTEAHPYRFSCPVRNCFRTYHTRYSLQYHYNNSHTNITPVVKNQLQKDSILEHNCNIVDANLNNSVLNTGQIHLDTTVQNQNIIDSDFIPSATDEEPIEPGNNFNNYFALIEQFVSQMYAFLNMPRSSIQNFIKIVESLFSNFVSDILALFNDSESTVDNLRNEVALIYFKIKDAFTELGSEYKRIKHFESSKFYIKPVVEVAGNIQKEKKVDDKIIMTLKEINISIVPPQKSLKLFLELPGVFSTICNYQKQLIEENKNNTDKVLRNIVQGTLWDGLIAKHDENDIILPLILSFDDLETGNPLGSHAGVNKLGAVYISIATIPPNMSSKLENIILTMLFYSKHRSTLGNEAIFKKLILDLKYLENIGIQICVDNEVFNVKFILVTIAGDNLGFNSILGFFESFNATYFCRICLTKTSDSEVQTNEDNSVLRKMENYDQHLEEGLNIKGPCVWHALPNFHVYNNCSIDVMHDLMEGIDRYSMALIIDKLIQSNYFSREQLNSRIKYFLYTDLETIPPPIIDNHLRNKCIIMSASEMLSLVRNFCFIVGDLVDRNDETWQYYLLLLEINEILTSQTFTHQLLEYLEYIIGEHHRQFIKLFNEKLKPKYHILLHYPQIIEKIGPPILVSSFKYEAKHIDIKHICNSMTCRKQLPLSVAIRSQLKSCFRYCSKIGFNDSINFSKYARINDKTVTHFSVDWYQINGVKYKIGMAILYNFDDCNSPIFCKIDEICIEKKDDKVVRFHCTLLDIIEYDAHFHAYNVGQTTEKKSISIDDCNSQSLMIRNINNKFFITMSKL